MMVYLLKITLKIMLIKSQALVGNLELIFEFTIECILGLLAYFYF